MPKGASRDFGDHSNYEDNDVAAFVSGERGDLVIDYEAGDSGAKIILPRLYYGNYKIVDDAGIEGLSLQKSSDAKLQLTVPPNSKGEIEVMFVVPPLWNYACLLSVVSLLAGLIIVIRVSCMKKKSAAKNTA